MIRVLRPLRFLAAVLLGSVLAAGVAAQSGVAAPRDSTNDGQSLIVVGDTVRAGASVTPEEAPFLACVLQNRFPQGTGITFRMQVIDPVTQQPMDPSQLQSVTLTLPDGSVMPLNYHPFNRGMSSDFGWFVMLPIPDDYPTGTLDVTILAEDFQGRTGLYHQFDSPTSMIQIVPKGQR